MPFRSSALPIAAAMIVALNLCACGNGGSDSGGSSVTPSGGPMVAVVSGTITTGTATSGIKVELRRNGIVIATTAADSAGHYAFPSVTAGNYEVMPIFGDWIFGPTMRTVQVAGSNVDVPAFSVTEEVASMTEAELDTQDASLAVEPFPGWEEIGLPAVSVRTKLLASAITDPGPAAGEDRRKWIIDKMLSQARDFYGCGHNKVPCPTWIKTAGVNPILQPEQKVLGYSYGRFDYSQRLSPRFSSCTYQIFGVECSGLMFNLAKDAGISTTTSGSWTQGDPTKWSIPADWDVRLVKVDAGSYKKGDILVWPAPNGHIGIAMEDGANPWVFSSTGSANACARNLLTGPRPVRANFLRSTKPVHALRFEAIASDVSISPNPASLQLNETVQLTAKTSQATATFTWLSDDSTIASVTSAGLATALKLGVTTIKVTDDATKKSAVGRIYVGPAIQITSNVCTSSGASSPDRCPTCTNYTSIVKAAVSGPPGAFAQATFGSTVYGGEKYTTDCGTWSADPAQIAVCVNNTGSFSGTEITTTETFIEDFTTIRIPVQGVLYSKDNKSLGVQRVPSGCP